MPSQLHALQEDHSRLRALLRNCENSSPRDLAPSLRRLEEAFEPHRQAKMKLYADSLQACEQAGDTTSARLLGLFRTNMNVTSSAVLGFLRVPDPDPERFHERFRTVASTLRSMLSTEEQVVFPIFLRHAPSAGGRS